MDNIVEMNWGSFTPELYNPNTNTMLHIFNHNLIGKTNILRSIEFCKGRIFWVTNYLDKNCLHEVIFDDRGQNIKEIDRKEIYNNLKDCVKSIKFLSDMEV